MSASVAGQQPPRRTKVPDRRPIRARDAARPALDPEAPAERISGLDGRSAERRFMRRERAALWEHVGGDPSPTQRAMIEQAVQLALRIHLMDLRFLKHGEMSEHDSRTYLAWSNSYTRTLARLGARKTVSRPLSLAEHYAKRPA